MRGLSSILSPFHNELNKFNNTGAQMLDSIYHLALRLFVMLTAFVSVTDLPFIDFKAWRYFTPRPDVNDKD